MTRRSTISMILNLAALCLIFLGTAGCGPVQTPSPTATPQPTPQSTLQPTRQPTLSLADTKLTQFPVNDFGAVHQAASDDPNKFLIFGNIPVDKPSADLPPEMAVYLGRWEGYGNFAPVKNDTKVVLVIQHISATGGKLYVYSGTNLQYPQVVGTIDFRIITADQPSLQWQINWPNGLSEVDTFSYDKASGKMLGWLNVLSNNTTTGPFELTRDRNFYVYKDYPAYLASKRIYAKEYQNSALTEFGKGYLVYLPQGYEADPQKAWPLIYFLHGMGDVGDNVYILAKASPFMFIRQHGPLPAIIVAPLANNSPRDTPFPEAYMDGVLKEAQAAYRIDPRRIYLTGLSMGGEATWRFALYRPDTFAAIAPLSAYLSGTYPTGMKPIQSLPVWAIHGADDTVVPLVMGQQPVDALKAIGGNVKFTILQGHDHDTWDDTYSDPAFYEWLFQYQHPTPTPAESPTPQPTLSLQDTSARDFSITDFSAVHQVDRSDPNKFLVFGAIPISKPAPGTPDDVAAFLGRWEGYLAFGPDKSYKFVVAVTEISAVGGKLYTYSAYDLQFPDRIAEVDFRIVIGDQTSLQYMSLSPDGISSSSYTFTIDKTSGKLVGWAQGSSNGSKTGPFELNRDQKLYVYKDYAAYLAGLHIYAKEYQNPALTQYGKGYLVYLPDGYEADAQKTWPLIFFLHGMGNTGDNVYVLAKNSPLMFIREHGPLPAIILAPLAGHSLSPSPFPDEYMDGVLKEAQGIYRIDPKRIYLTGLSMGGEATWRFALDYPDTFAAVAPLSGYFTFARPENMKVLADVPVWAFHGSNDTVIPLELGRIPVDALIAAGGNVKFTVLQGYGHDTWTVTYSDPAFYEWMFQQQKP
jgi:predicted peptidase